MMIFWIMVAINVLGLGCWHFSTRNPRNAEYEQQRSFGLIAVVVMCAVMDLVVFLVERIASMVIHGR